MSHIKKYCFEYVILVLGVLFFFINEQIPLMSDDILYGYIFPAVPLEKTPWGIDISAPVENFLDILESQYNHYFLHGGRTPVHILVQLFSSIVPKDVYSLISSVFFGLFITFLGLASMGKKSNSDRVQYFIPFIIFFVSMIHPKCFFSTIACGINYLWSSVFCLMAWYFCTQRKNISKYALIPVFILCFTAGWSHEGIVMPLSIALISYWLFEVRKIKDWRTLAIIIFGIGAALLIFAPGNFVRSNDSEFYKKALIVRGYGFCKSLRMFYIFGLAIALTYWRLGKEITKTWVFQNKHLLIGLLLSFPIFMYIGPVAARVGFGVELISAILFGSLTNINLEKESSKTKVNFTSYTFTIATLLILGTVLYYQVNAGKQIAHVVRSVESEQTDVVRVKINNETPSFMRSFVQQYSIREAPDWNKSVWEFKYNKTIELIEF